MGEKTNNRCYEISAGTMYLICMITSISGGLLIEHVVANENLLQALDNSSMVLVIATILELINAFGVLVIAVSFYIMLRKLNPAMATAYLIIRSIEAAFCIGISFLPLISLTCLSIPNANAEQQIMLVNYLLLIRTTFWAYIYPVIFVFGGAIFYSLLYITRILPRYIALWGLLALIGVLMAMLTPELKMIPGLLIISNEIYLGFYLLFKK